MNAKGIETRSDETRSGSARRVRARCVAFAQTHSVNPFGEPMTDQTRDIVERLRSDDDSYDLRDEAVCAIEALTKRVAELEEALTKARAKLRGAVEPDDVALNEEIDAALSNAARGEEI
jgi:type I site-specific restriction endonuclease